MLTDALSPAEMAHLTAVLQEPDHPVSEDAFDDYVRVITQEHQRTSFSGEAEDLRTIQEQLRKKKGYGGT